MRSLIYDLDMPYSFTEASKVKEDILLLAKEFKSRELPQNLFAMLIDAYHTELRDDSDGKIKKAVIFTVLGITLDAKKTHLGFYLFFGSENKSKWIEIFNNIISRGMKKSLLIISDDFPDSLKLLILCSLTRITSSALYTLNETSLKICPKSIPLNS